MTALRPRASRAKPRLGALLHGSAILALCATAGCFDWQAPDAGPTPASDPQQQNSGSGGGDDGSGAGTPDPSTSGAGATGGASGDVSSAAATTSGVTSGVGVGGGGTGTCEGNGCDACIQCAIDDVCAAEAAACAADQGCAFFSDCISQCIDPQCIADCADIEPDGASIFQDAANCVVCGACAQDCADLTDLVGCN